MLERYDKTVHHNLLPMELYSCWPVRVLVLSCPNAYNGHISIRTRPWSNGRRWLALKNHTFELYRNSYFLLSVITHNSINASLINYLGHFFLHMYQQEDDDTSPIDLKKYLGDLEMPFKETVLRQECLFSLLSLIKSRTFRLEFTCLSCCHVFSFYHLIFLF